MTNDESPALAFFPAIAIGRGRSFLDFAVVTAMAHASAFGAAAQRSGESAGATLENVLMNVLGAGPSEAASVVAASDEKRRQIGIGVGRKNHRRAIFAVASDALNRVQ